MRNVARRSRATRRRRAARDGCSAAHNQKGEEASGLATSAASAKEEIADLRERCRRAERGALPPRNAPAAPPPPPQTKKQTRTEPRPRRRGPRGSLATATRPRLARLVTRMVARCTWNPSPPGRELPAAAPVQLRARRASRVDPARSRSRLPAARPFSPRTAARLAEPSPFPVASSPRLARSARRTAAARRAPGGAQDGDTRAAGFDPATFPNRTRGRDLCGRNRRRRRRARARGRRGPGPTSEPALEPAPVPVADAAPLARVLARIISDRDGARSRRGTSGSVCRGRARARARG